MGVQERSASASACVILVKTKSVGSGQRPIAKRRGGREMIRELFIAFVLLSLIVTVTAWFRGGPQLSVQKVEANLAR